MTSRSRQQQRDIATASVDLVVSTISFHHWRDQQRGLTEVRRLLSPTGRLLLADPIVTPWLRPFFAVARARDRFHTRPELDRILGEAGLRPTSHSTVPRMWAAVAITIAVPA